MRPEFVRHLIRKVTIFAGAGLVLLLISHFLNSRDNAKSGGTGPLQVADYGRVDDFSLTERSGRTVTLKELNGTPWIADFIFTRCAGPCPLLSFQMSKLQKKFLSTTDIKFVSFSVDPSYDTPSVLSAYAARYDADPTRWLFLTGESDKIHQLVLRSFHLAMEKNVDPGQKEGEQVNHSLNFVLVGRDGHIRNYYNGNDRSAVERLEKDIQTVAAEK